MLTWEGLGQDKTAYSHPEERKEKQRETSQHLRTSSTAHTPWIKVNTFVGEIGATKVYVQRFFLGSKHTVAQSITFPLLRDAANSMKVTVLHSGVAGKCAVLLPLPPPKVTTAVLQNF